jgi:hypothetical protein
MSGGNIRLPSTAISRQYAPVLASVPGHIAAVFVAFAGMGATPVSSKAGKEMKLPPPATEFSSPPKRAAINRKTAWPVDTQ